MSKFIFAFSVVVLVTTCYAAAVEFSTNLAVVVPGTSILKSNGQQKIVKKINIPDDDGYSNWGDEVYKKREDGDVLLLRDLVIYPVVSSRDQTLHYSVSFKYLTKVTSVRLINIGRERAYGTEIDVSGAGVDVYFILPAERDPRVLIEVYGFNN